MGGASARRERSDGPEIIFRTARVEVLIQHKDLVEFQWLWFCFRRGGGDIHTYAYVRFLKIEEPYYAYGASSALIMYRVRPYTLGILQSHTLRPRALFVSPIIKCNLPYKYIKNSLRGCSTYGASSAPFEIFIQHKRSCRISMALILFGKERRRHRCNVPIMRMVLPKY